jgi:hypothetical protein
MKSIKIFKLKLQPNTNYIKIMKYKREARKNNQDNTIPKTNWIKTTKHKEEDASYQTTLPMPLQQCHDNRFTTQNQPYLLPNHPSKTTPTVS